MELSHREHYIPIIPLCGALAGVLSSVPLISCLNCCFFAWVVGAGVLAVKLVGNRAGAPVVSGEGLVIGGLTGIICGLVSEAGWILLNVIFHVGSIIDLLGFTDDVPDVTQKPWFGAVGTACIALFFHPLFAAIGGLLGTYLTRNEGTAFESKPLSATYTAPSQRLSDLDDDR